MNAVLVSLPSPQEYMVSFHGLLHKLTQESHKPVDSQVAS